MSLDTEMFMFAMLGVAFIVAVFTLVMYYLYEYHEYKAMKLQEENYAADKEKEFLERIKSPDFFKAMQKKKEKELKQKIKSFEKIATTMPTIPDVFGSHTYVFSKTKTQPATKKKKTLKDKLQIRVCKTKPTKRKPK